LYFHRQCLLCFEKPLEEPVVLQCHWGLKKAVEAQSGMSVDLKTVDAWMEQWKNSLFHFFDLNTPLIQAFNLAQVALFLDQENIQDFLISLHVCKKAERPFCFKIQYQSGRWILVEVKWTVYLSDLIIASHSIDLQMDLQKDSTSFFNLKNELERGLLGVAKDIDIPHFLNQSALGSKKTIKNRSANFSFEF
jgi:hypothetical protein